PTIREESHHMNAVALVELAALTAAVHREEIFREAEPPIGRQLDELAHELAEAILAVGGKTHHLVFLAKVIEADELAGRRVAEAQAVWQSDAIENLDLRAFTACHHCADKIAAGIERESGRCSLVGRAVIRARDMRKMVLDRYELRVQRRRIHLAG